MGIIDNEVVFNGVSTKDFNIYCSGRGSYSSPSRQYDAIKIAGKSGISYRDKKTFDNVSLEYKCLIYGDISDYERFKAFLLSQGGYKRLEDSFHPDEYRMAVYRDSINPNIKGDEEGASFILNFECLPQRYLKSGENPIQITTNGSIINNLHYDAKPLIRVYESGSISINGKTLTYTNVDGYMDIDCEEMDCYKGSTNMNRYVSGDFPVLTNGINQITCTGTINLIPRWWTL